MEMVAGVPVWGSPIDEGAFLQIANCSKEAAHVALMADHHKGYAVPIGGVVAYVDKVSPSGVGFDIGCGNKGGASRRAGEGSPAQDPSDHERCLEEPRVRNGTEQRDGCRPRAVRR